MLSSNLKFSTEKFYSWDGESILCQEYTILGFLTFPPSPVRLWITHILSVLINKKVIRQTYSCFLLKKNVSSVLRVPSELCFN